MLASFSKCMEIPNNFIEFAGCFMSLRHFSGIKVKIHKHGMFQACS